LKCRHQSHRIAAGEYAGQVLVSTMRMDPILRRRMMRHTC
jgi:hypothetical protein